MSFFRKDWVERQIEQVMAALAALLALRQERRFGEAEKLVARTVAELTGLEYRTVLAMAPSLIAGLLDHAQKIAALGRLLREDARLLRDRKDPAFLERYELAIRFFLEAEGRNAPCRDERVELQTEAREAGRGISPPPIS